MDRNHLKLTLLTTIVPANAAQAVAESLHTDEPQGGKVKKGSNIIGKIKGKIRQKREERFYKDEEWD